MILSDRVGPATLQTAAHASSSNTPFSHFPDISELRTNLKSENIALLANVKVEPERTMANGRLKLKLVLSDVPVDQCGICSMQFKHNELARLGSLCRHGFHEECLGRWLSTSMTCPTCHVPLIAQERVEKPFGLQQRLGNLAL